MMKELKLKVARSVDLEELYGDLVNFLEESAALIDADILSDDLDANTIAKILQGVADIAASKAGE